MARLSHRSPTTAGWVLLKRGPRKPAPYPHPQIYPLFRISTHTLNAVEVWPHAQRQVMLSCPSSLPGHSDFPTPITSILPVSPDLIQAYRRRRPAETLGSQVFPPLSVTACRWPYPGSLPGAHTLCFPGSSGLLPNYRGSAGIPAMQGLSLNRTLPAIAVRSHLTRLHHSRHATACGFGRHP